MDSYYVWVVEEEDGFEEMSAFLTGVLAKDQYHEALAVMHYHFTFGTR